MFRWNPFEKFGIKSLTLKPFTEDKDFGEIVYRLNKPAHGIILIRVGPKMEI